MAIETTPLGFQKPDGNDPVKNGDNVIAANAQKADDLLSNLPNLYMPLSRGVLANGTDLNTLNGAAHVGDYSLLSTNTYPNGPALTSAAVLEVRRGSGNTLSVVHRVTSGNFMLWREAVDAAAGTWTAWVQAETTANAATKNAEQDVRLAAVEAKQAVKGVRLEAGKWVWDLAAGTHYLLPDHTGALVARATPWPVPSTTTKTLDW